MSLRQAIIRALEAQCEPISGRAVAIEASMPYKAAVDALGRLFDAGIVVRFGRKYSAKWALAGWKAALPDDGLAALEAAWHARTPPPTGGEAATAPPPRV